MINRLTYSVVCVEITRRCNIKCAHCLRGDAQDLNMSHDAVDAFMYNTEEIYSLHFTGGEPFLNIDGIRYFLESAKRHNTIIDCINIVTNGTVQTREVIDVLQEYSDYIAQFFESDVPLTSHIKLSISIDRFHSAFADSEAAYNWYADNLSNIATIIRCRGGEVVVKKGRAKNLSYSYLGDPQKYSKIQYKTSNNDSFCPMSKQFPLLHNNQIVILCPIYITALGSMRVDEALEYDIEDTNDSQKGHIGSVFAKNAKEILQNIEQYNNNKPYCLELDTSRPNKNSITSYINYLKFYKTLTKIRDNAPDNDYLLNVFLKPLIGNLNHEEIAIAAQILNIDTTQLEKVFNGDNDIWQYILELNNSFEVDNNDDGFRLNSFIDLNNALDAENDDNKKRDIVRDYYKKTYEQSEQRAAEAESQYQYKQELLKKIKIEKMSDEDKEYYNLLLQSYNSSQKLAEMNPDSTLYESMLADDKARLEAFETKHCLTFVKS